MPAIACSIRSANVVRDNIVHFFDRKILDRKIEPIEAGEVSKSIALFK